MDAAERVHALRYTSFSYKNTRNYDQLRPCCQTVGYVMKGSTAQRYYSLSSIVTQFTILMAALQIHVAGLFSTP